MENTSDILIYISCAQSMMRACAEMCVRECRVATRRICCRKTTAGPCLTNRNDSYQSSSLRVACVCVYRAPRARLVEYLRISFFSPSEFLSRQRGCEATPIHALVFPLPRLLSSFRIVLFMHDTLTCVVQTFVVVVDDDVGG